MLSEDVIWSADAHQNNACLMAGISSSFYETSGGYGRKEGKLLIPGSQLG